MAGRDVEHFDSGATRNSAGNKYDYEGFINPLVIQRFGQYMHEHRHQRDGTVRDSDNWQLGIPLNNYAKSLIRHTQEFHLLHRDYTAIDPDSGKEFTKEELCCAIMFNVMGYLKEILDPEAVNRDAD